MANGQSWKPPGGGRLVGRLAGLLNMKSIGLNNTSHTKCDKVRIGKMQATSATITTRVRWATACAGPQGEDLLRRALQRLGHEAAQLKEAQAGPGTERCARQANWHRGGG